MKDEGGGMSKVGWGGGGRAPPRRMGTPPGGGRLDPPYS
jgi:hypothetical protein